MVQLISHYDLSLTRPLRSQTGQSLVLNVTFFFRCHHQPSTPERSFSLPPPEITFEQMGPNEVDRF